MKLLDCQHLYDLMDLFLEEFLINKNSILTDDSNILTKRALQNVRLCFIGNYNEGEGSFGEKVKQQFKDADFETRMVFAHIEWLWSYSTDDIMQKTRRSITQRMLNIGGEQRTLKDVFPGDRQGFGKAGMYYTQNKYDEVKFLFLTIEFIYIKLNDNLIPRNSATLKQWIEAICIYKRYGNETDGYELSDELKNSLKGGKVAMANILLHLTIPEKYERIASDNHKGQILSAYYGLLEEEEKEDKNLDERLLLIRQKLSTITNSPNLDFYQSKYSIAWNYSLHQEGFDEIQAILYKKAIILYGPPGTSKTHSANRLGTALITKRFLEKKENVITYFNGDKSYLEKRIHHLQLHTNYQYEDFVAGMQLRDNNTVPQKGKLFEICEAASKDTFPHVLILDEINRVDLSRLFGEVFSALENRNKPISTGVGNFELIIPDNLYVIGTMNEIDFSLERIDFALRRRFLWFFYGYNKNTLRDIIRQKNETLKTRLPKEEINKFINAATNLNKEITSIKELGAQYQIGHTFFAEIVDIYASYASLHNYTRITKKLYRNDGPVHILWTISIEPMLDAFLGNLDEETKKRFLTRLKKIYLN